MREVLGKLKRLNSYYAKHNQLHIVCFDDSSGALWTATDNFFAEFVDLNDLHDLLDREIADHEQVFCAGLVDVIRLDQL